MNKLCDMNKTNLYIPFLIFLLALTLDAETILKDGKTQEGEFDTKTGNLIKGKVTYEDGLIEKEHSIVKQDC